MNTSVLSQAETFFNFFLLILTLILAYGKKHCRHAVLCCAIFTAAYMATHLLYERWPGPLVKEISPPLDFIIWYLFLLGSAFLFALLFVRGKFRDHLVLIVTFVCSTDCIKGFSSFIRPLAAQRHLSDFTMQLLIELFILICLILSAVFFVRHPLTAVGSMPLRYWFCIAALPIALDIYMILYILLAYSANSYAAFDLVMYAIVEVVVLLVYYLCHTIITTYDHLQDSRLINQRMQIQIDGLERSSAMIEQIRHDKHEMKNVYFYIESLVNAGEYEELTSFVNEKLAHRFDAIEEFRTGNRLIDFLLTQKMAEARASSIHVVTNLLIPAKLPIGQDDLCALLLNLLDNAITASQSEPEGDIYISIREIKNYLAIHIRNRCSEDVLQKNPQLKTSKKDADNHGIGLRVVRAIAQKYNGIFKTCMENGYFVADVMLSLPEGKEARS